MKFLKLILIIAGSFTLVMSFPLAIPGVFTEYISTLWSLNLALGLGGREPFIPNDGAVLMIINHAGVELISLSVLIIYASFDPVARKFIIYLTMIGRSLFAVFAFYYTYKFDGMQLFYIVGITDIILMVVMLYALYSAHHLLYPRRIEPSE